MPAGKGKRVPLNMRTTQELRDRVAQAAANSGRSLVQEVEARLEQSFQEEDGVTREFGGRETAALFRMMAGAAEIIEERRGKSYLTDWETYLAVRAAWQKLIADVNPKPEPGYFETLGIPSTDDDLPPAPVPPEPAVSIADLMANVYQVRTPEEEAEYQKQFAEDERRRKAFEGEVAEWLKVLEEHQTALKRGLQYFRDIHELGEETVAGLFPPRETK